MMKRKPTFEERKEKYGDSADRQNTVWSEEIVKNCDHNWQPVSFRYETQLLDADGRVLIRQPDLTKGRVYCVCMECLSHTYIETGWVGFYIGSPDLLEEDLLSEKERKG